MGNLCVEQPLPSALVLSAVFLAPIGHLFDGLCLVLGETHVSNVLMVGIVPTHECGVYSLVLPACVNRYIAKAYDRINLTVPKGQKDLIKEYADSLGKSVNAYIQDLIEEDMKKNS